MNKQIIHVVILAFFISLFMPFTSYAGFGSMNKPMGGKIIMTSMPGVTCAAQYGPFFMIPYKGPAGPYIITASTKGEPKVNGHILGLYKSSQNSYTCYTDTTPPVSVPVYEMTSTYAVSK